MKSVFIKYKQVIIYGASLSLLILLLKWLEWKFLIVNNSLNIYIGLIAVFFTVLGVWIASHIAKPKIQTVVVEKEVIVTRLEEFSFNEAELQKLNLTSREWDVLQQMSQGKSNIEIAETLFLSVSTIKTHASNLFLKMDVKSRAQAIEKAKRLKITR